MHTAGTFTQGKPNTDLEIFVGVQDISYCAQDGAQAFPQAPSDTNHLPAIKFGPVTATGTVSVQLSKFLQRVGILQSTNFTTNTSQEAFGTSNGPGPNSIPGTSGPYGFGPDQVVPPIVGARVPTIASSTPGAPKKGVQINWIDTILNSSGAIAAYTHTLSVYKIIPGTPGTITKTVLQTALSPGAINANPIARVRLTVANPAMITDDFDVIDFLITQTASVPAAILYGFIVGCSYNLN